MRSATSLLQQTLPGAYGVCADDETALIDDEAFNVEAHEALESAVQALGYYTCAVKEARKSLMPAEPLLQLIEKLEVAQAQARFNAVPPELRLTHEGKAELHMLVEEMQERLWALGDEKREAAEALLQAMAADEWLSHHAHRVLLALPH